MRRQELSAVEALAARELLGVYERLAARGAHALSDLLGKSAPLAWERLPADDAVDRAGLYQWFYHSHGADDGRGPVEHGHIHLFARRKLWENLADDEEERRFAELAGGQRECATRHLLGISLDAKGVPIALFAVESRITGDAMLGARATLEALARLALDTGFPELDRLISSLAKLCLPEVRSLLARRDEALRDARARGVEAAEVLAEVPLDLDAKIASALGATPGARRPARAGPRRRAPAPARAGTSAGARAR